MKIIKKKKKNIIHPYHATTNTLLIIGMNIKVLFLGALNNDVWLSFFSLNLDLRISSQVGRVTIIIIFNL